MPYPRFENLPLQSKIIFSFLSTGFVLTFSGFWLIRLYLYSYFPAGMEYTVLLPMAAAKLVCVTLAVVMSVSLIVLYISINLQVLKPLKHLQQAIDGLVQGELTTKTRVALQDQTAVDKRAVNKIAHDEIGQMLASITLLTNNLQACSAFASQMAEGDLTASFKPASGKDRLGKALLQLRTNLSEVKKEETMRSWSREGYAQFSDILRNTDEIKTLAADLISSLVKYLGANQGGFFIRSAAQEDTKTDTQYELAAAYAYGRKKYLTKTIYLGEGLLGACVQEKDTIYLTDVPQGYCSISSGLGEASPSSILIVPLKIEEQILGVVELASFKEYQGYEIEFVEKIASNIASCILSIQTNENTLRLLTASRQQAEELKAGEEELRQNLEELAATQDEMGRSKKEIEQLLEESMRKETIMQEQEKMMRVSLEEVTLMQGQLYEKDRKQVKEIKELQQSYQSKEEEMKQLLEEMQVSEKDMQQTEDKYRSLLIEFQTLQQAQSNLQARLEQKEAENQLLKKSLKP
jgi:putative methionine-R-sulfoxide reductase with GAF domain/HAMP domain-containing protein